MRALWLAVIGAVLCFAGDIPATILMQTSGGMSATLVLSLPFNGDINDASGNGLTTDFSGGTESYASVGGGVQALDCDGNQNTVTVDDAAVFTDLDEYTVLACLNLDGYGGGSVGRVFHWQKGSGSTAVYLSTRATGEFYLFDAQHATFGGWDTNASAYSLSSTFHAAVTVDGSADAVEYFIDGSAVTTNEVDTPSGFFTPDTATLRICNRSDKLRGLDGRIWRFKIYDGVLTSGEISTIAGSDCP